MMECDKCSPHSYIAYIHEKSAYLKTVLPWWLWASVWLVECSMCMLVGVLDGVATKPLSLASRILPLLKYIADTPNKLASSTKTIATMLLRKAALYFVRSWLGRIIVWVVTFATRLNRKALAYLDKDGCERREQCDACGLRCTLKCSTGRALHTSLIGTFWVLESMGMFLHRYGCRHSHHHRNGHATSPRKTRPRRKLSPQKHYSSSLFGRVMWCSKKILGISAALPRINPVAMEALDRECCADVVCECDKKRKYDDILSDSNSDCDNLLNFDESKYISEEDATFLPEESSSDSLEYNEGETESEPEINPDHMICTNDITATTELISGTSGIKTAHSEDTISSSSMLPSSVPTESGSILKDYPGVNNSEGILKKGSSNKVTLNADKKESSKGTPNANKESSKRNLNADKEISKGTSNAEKESSKGTPNADKESGKGTPNAEKESGKGTPNAEKESGYGTSNADIESSKGTPNADGGSNKEIPNASDRSNIVIPHVTEIQQHSVPISDAAKCKNESVLNDYIVIHNGKRGTAEIDSIGKDADISTTKAKDKIIPDTKKDHKSVLDENKPTPKGKKGVAKSTTRVPKIKSNGNDVTQGHSQSQGGEGNCKHGTVDQSPVTCDDGMQAATTSVKADSARADTDDVVAKIV